MNQGQSYRQSKQSVFKVLITMHRKKEKKDIIKDKLLPTLTIYIYIKKGEYRNRSLPAVFYTHHRQEQTHPKGSTGTSCSSLVAHTTTLTYR